MRVVKQLCGEGCMNITEGPWYWLLALWLADRLHLPFRAWAWVYDHTSESPWQPGHIGEPTCPKCWRELALEVDGPDRIDYAALCPSCGVGGEGHA